MSVFLPPCFPVTGIFYSKYTKKGKDPRPSPFNTILSAFASKKLFYFYLLGRFPETMDIAVALYDKCAGLLQVSQEQNCLALSLQDPVLRDPLLLRAQYSRILPARSQICRPSACRKAASADVVLRLIGMRDLFPYGKTNFESFPCLLPLQVPQLQVHAFHL